MDDLSKQVLKKYLIGGAALGGGTALVTSLLNYLKHLKNSQGDSAADDDTIYVYKDDDGQQKEAGFVSTGIGMAGGTAAAIGAYALVKKLYAKMRQQQAQEELDRAQHIFLGAQGYRDVNDRPKKKKKDEEEKGEQEKKAADGRSNSLLESVTAAPVAVPLLLALASGVVTNEVLKSKYGAPKPKVKPPKRIEVVEKPADDVDEYKSASVDREKMMDDACDFMIRFTLENPVPHSDLTDVVKTAALGGYEGFKDTVMTVGFENAMEMVKGASFHTVDPLAEHLAICCLNKSARLKHCVRLVAAGEFAEKYPELYKQASNLDEEVKEQLLKIAGLLGIAFRAERSQELGVKAEGFDVKEAAVALPGEEEDLLSELVAKINKGKSGEVESTSEEKDVATEGDEYESSDTSGEEAGISDPDSPSRAEGGKLNFIRSGKTTRTYAKDQDKDVIDEILSAQ